MDRPVPECCEGRCGRRCRVEDEKEEGEEAAPGGKSSPEGGSERHVSKDVRHQEERDGTKARDKGGGCEGGWREEPRPQPSRHPPESRATEERNRAFEGEVRERSRSASYTESGPVSRRNPEECVLPTAPSPDEGAGAEDDFDDDYLPALPRITMGRTILHETESESRVKKIQLQEMRNVVFGFPEIEPGVVERRRERRAGTKSVSWKDEGAVAGSGRRETSEGSLPRPIIKRSTSLPTGGAVSRVEDSFGNSMRIPSLLHPEDESGGRRLGTTRLKSPEPGGAYIEYPVHASPLGSPKKTSSDCGEQSEGESSGEEEFEEQAFRVLSDILVEATTLLEGFRRASVRSPEAGKKRKEGKCEMGSQEEVPPTLDAKEVLAALQSRLSDRHLMKSPPKTGRDTVEGCDAIPPAISGPSASYSTTPANFSASIPTAEAGPPRHLYREENVFNTEGFTAPQVTYPTANRFQTGGVFKFDPPVSRTSDWTAPGSTSKFPYPERPCSVTEERSAANPELRKYPNRPADYRDASDSRWDSSTIDAWRNRLQEETADRQVSDPQYNHRNSAAGVQRSESENHVSRLGYLERPSSPDILPEFGRTGFGIKSLSAVESRSPFLGAWSSPGMGGFLRDEESLDPSTRFLPQERAWRSSNALYPPSPRHAVPLRESLSDAAICSPKTSTGSCCLHGQEICQRETRVHHHHHHHHHHHYAPFAVQEWKNSGRRLPWWDQDEDEESLHVWRGSAPQLSHSEANHSPLGPYSYNSTTLQKEVKKEPGCLSSPGREWPKEPTQTPYASAPNSPFRSHPISPLQRQDPQRPTFVHPQSPTSMQPPLLSHSSSMATSNSIPLSSCHNPPYPSSYASPPRSPSQPMPRVASHSVPDVPSHVHAHLNHCQPHLPPYSKPQSKFQPGPHQMPCHHPQSHPCAAFHQNPHSHPHDSNPYPGHHQPACLRSCSPPFPSVPVDLGWDEDVANFREGFGPRAYLRHLVGVRKEVVAATRACNPKVPSSTGATSRPT